MSMYCPRRSHTVGPILWYRDMWRDKSFSSFHSSINQLLFHLGINGALWSSVNLSYPNSKFNEISIMLAPFIGK